MALLRIREVGVDGTDQEINAGLYGEAPPGASILILAHEAVATVEEPAANGAGPSRGTLVVPTVRRPDDCVNCRAGEVDMCLAGNYTEHGIRGRHGFAAEYAATEADFLVPTSVELAGHAVLLEPLSIAEKAVDQIQRIQKRLRWDPRRALVLGAGPLGLLCTLLLRLQGLEVVAAATKAPPNQKADLVLQLGAEYRSVLLRPLDAQRDQFDVVIEASGSAGVAAQALATLNRNGVACLLGVYAPFSTQLEVGNLLKEIVLGNRVVFGSVNANRRHFEMGVADLAAARTRFSGFLTGMITQRLPLREYTRALHPDPDDIKTVFAIGDLSPR